MVITINELGWRSRWSIDAELSSWKRRQRLTGNNNMTFNYTVNFPSDSNMERCIFIHWLILFIYLPCYYYYCGFCCCCCCCVHFFETVHENILIYNIYPREEQEHKVIIILEWWSLHQKTCVQALRSFAKMYMSSKTFPPWRTTGAASLMTQKKGSRRLT